MENHYFQKALSDFTHEAASGGAIRHLTDLGYTVKQITEQLDFPTPYERVQRAVWERLTDTGVILPGEPGSGRRKQKAAYVQERDKFGRTSFRRVTEEEKPEHVICWKERQLNVGGTNEGDGFAGDSVFALLQAKVRENGEEYSYAACDFGRMASDTPGQYREMLLLLEETQREYVEGLLWGKRRVYHRMNSRMMEILAQLCGTGQYQGDCFFLKSEEKIRIGKSVDPKRSDRTWNG